MDKSVRRLILGLLIVISIFTGLVYLNYVSLIADHSNTASTIPMPNEKSISGLRVVVDDDYPPYTFRNENGVAVGIIVDYWRLWEKKTGIPVEITCTEWNKAQQGLLNGEYDVIDVIAKSEERMRLYAFSPPYTTVDLVIAYKTSGKTINSMDDLNTLTVGGLKGDFAISTLHHHGILSILEYPRYADVVDAALRNDIDCFIMAKASADYLLRKNNAMNQFRFYGPIQQGIMHRAVKCGNENILETVETGNAKILPSEYADIERRWLSETMGFTNKMKMVLIVPSIACIVILLLMFWILRLKAQVQKRASELTGIVNAMPDQILTFTADGTITDHKAGKGLSLTLENFSTKTLYDIMPEHTAEIALNCLKRAVATRQVEVLEYETVSDKSTHYYEARFVATTPDTILGIIRDISARKAAEK